MRKILIGKIILIVILCCKTLKKQVKLAIQFKMRLKQFNPWLLIYFLESNLPTIPNLKQIMQHIPIIRLFIDTYKRLDNHACNISTNNPL